LSLDLILQFVPMAVDEIVLPVQAETPDWSSGVPMGRGSGRLDPSRI